MATVEDGTRDGVVYLRPVALAGELRYSLLLPDASDAAAVTRTLDSLVAQDNPCWELLLHGPTPAVVQRAIASFAAETAERVAVVPCPEAADRGARLDRLLAAAGGG